MTHEKISLPEHLRSDAWWLLALDPGSPDVGVALFANGILVKAQNVKIKRKPDAQCPMCAKPCRHQVESQTISEICDAIEEWIDEIMGPGKRPAIVIAEQVQAFQSRRNDAVVRHHKASDRSVLLCYGVMAALLDRAMGWGARTFQYTPATIKGAMKKDQFQRRAMLLLSDAEKRQIERRPIAGDVNSDAADAAAIALTWLLRVGYRRRG